MFLLSNGFSVKLEHVFSDNRSLRSCAVEYSFVSTALTAVSGWLYWAILLYLISTIFPLTTFSLSFLLINACAKFRRLWLALSGCCRYFVSVTSPLNPKLAQGLNSIHKLQICNLMSHRDKDFLRFKQRGAPNTEIGLELRVWCFHPLLN